MTRRNHQWALGAGAAAALALTVTGCAAFDTGGHPTPVDTYVSTSSATATPSAAGGYGR